MKRGYKNQLKGYLFLLPITVIIFTFMLLPFGNGLYLSFFKTKYGFGDMNFAGIQNYIKVFSMEGIGNAFFNSLKWVLISLGINTVLPFAIALLLNRNFKGKNIVLASVLIPWMTPVTAYAMIWRWLLEPNIGAVNRVLLESKIVDHAITFLSSTSLALPTLIVISCMQFMPMGVLLMSSALSTIPNEQYDSMKVDGATYLQTLKNLIMPSVGQIMGFMLFLGAVQTFNNYSLIHVLTKGGPSNSTTTIPLLIYQKAFAEFNIGQAMALASMVGIVLIILGILFFRNFYKVES